MIQNVKITGTTRITGLLGNPVKHSISPLIHNHAFSSLGLNYCYVPLGCAADQLETVVKSLRALNFAGANVTIPYKSDVVPFCDEISDLSKLTGTVNTLYMKEGRLCGTTTDGEGFLSALKEDGFDPSGKKIVILGNGGTSRTLGMVLAHLNIPQSLALAGRNPANLEPLADEITAKTGAAVETAQFGSAKADRLLSEADLVVNCTPVGMNPAEPYSPIPVENMHKGCYYFDAIYNPAETPFLKQARELGASGQNGLRMLLLQGLASFKYWTGESAPVNLFNLDELLAAIEGK